MGAPDGYVEVLVPSAENSPSVRALGEGKTISVHVYGADVERLGSHRHDDISQLPVPDRRFPG